MIIWLASYPKSGNTLLRSMLGAYFFSNDGEFNFDHVYKIGQFPSYKHFQDLGINIKDNNQILMNYINAQNLINKKSKGVKFLKTHSVFIKNKDNDFTNLKNTLGAIYVVRDPRNVVTSFAHHYQLDINSATENILFEDSSLAENERLPKTFISSWGLNYNSWKILGNKTLVIKYEDLILKKKDTLMKVFNFLETLGMNKSNLNINKIDKIIETTEFKKMQKLEKEKNFKESIIDDNTGKKKPFFNLGPENDWKKILNEDCRKRIEKNFSVEMEELGYL